MNQQVDSRESAAAMEHEHTRSIDYVIDIIKELPSLAEKKNLSKQQVESLFALGYQLYEAQCYREAGDLFRFVCFFESKTAHYWIALGGGISTQQTS